MPSPYRFDSRLLWCGWPVRAAGGAGPTRGPPGAGARGAGGGPCASSDVPGKGRRGRRLRPAHAGAGAPTYQERIQLPDHLIFHMTGMRRARITRPSVPQCNESRAAPAGRGRRARRRRENPHRAPLSATRSIGGRRPRAAHPPAAASRHAVRMRALRRGCGSAVRGCRPGPFDNSQSGGGTRGVERFQSRWTARLSGSRRVDRRTVRGGTSISEGSSDLGRPDSERERTDACSARDHVPDGRNR